MGPIGQTATSEQKKENKNPQEVLFKGKKKQERKKS
jgi:hypothetical protein